MASQNCQGISSYFITNGQEASACVVFAMGDKSKGVKGIKVGTLRDDEGGSLKATFDIPSELVGKSKIDIRLENKSLGIVTYLTFEN